MSFIIIPETIAESAISGGYLEITGRHVKDGGFNVYLSSLIGDTRGRVHILISEQGHEQEIVLQFDGTFGPNGYDIISAFSAQILLKPGKYTVKPKKDTL